MAQEKIWVAQTLYLIHHFVNYKTVLYFGSCFINKQFIKRKLENLNLKEIFKNILKFS